MWEEQAFISLAGFYEASRRDSKKWNIDKYSTHEYEGERVKLQLHHFGEKKQFGIIAGKKPCCVDLINWNFTTWTTLQIAGAATAARDRHSEKKKKRKTTDEKKKQIQKKKYFRMNKMNLG